MAHKSSQDADAEDQAIADLGHEWASNVAMDRDGLNYYVRSRKAHKMPTPAIVTKKPSKLAIEDRVAATAVVNAVRNGTATADYLLSQRMPALVAAAAKISGKQTLFASKADVISALMGGECV